MVRHEKTVEENTKILLLIKGAQFSVREAELQVVSMEPLAEFVWT